MSARPTIHYLNADFDLRLRARSSWHEKTTLRRQVDELSWQALLGATDGETVITPIAPPQPFADHLRRYQLGATTRRPQGIERLAGSFQPYGWSEETIALNATLASPTAHPTLETVRKVNSRSFALELERRLGVDSAASTTVQSLDALTRLLAAQPADSEWLLKGEHGNSGLANRRLHSTTLTDADIRFAERSLNEDDQLLVERWLDRSRDWCVVFDVPFTRRTARIHEPFCTRDGALIGALFDPALDAPDALYETAAAVAAQLEEQGYFGPVCIDAFEYRDGATTHLREIADLNCRQSMTTPAYLAWRRLAPTASLYYRFFNRKKLDLPTTLELAQDALGDHRFEAERQRGILFTSPLSCAKLSVMFIESNRERLFALERWFRDRFER